MMELIVKKADTVRNAMQYAEKLGEGGGELASAIVAAFCAGHAAGKASAARTEEEKTAPAEKKEG